jgi:hypothetical protein
MRGTNHDLSIRKFIISKGGIWVESAFRGYTGLISGVARRMYTDFREEEGRITAKQEKGQVERREAFDKRLKRLQTPKPKTVRRKA